MNSEQNEMLSRIDERVGNLSGWVKGLSERTAAVEKHQDRQDGAWKALVIVSIAVSCITGLIITVLMG